MTTRGTNSSSRFSRGNNIPATAVPHGFNFWVPVTNAGTLSWLYEYQFDNTAENLPALEAFSLSHQPSPWMGDRQTFQVMPSAADGDPPLGRAERRLPFRHANEVASPHRYAVTFENGIKTEIAPTDHAALMRFTFPGDSSSLVFDNVNGDWDMELVRRRRPDRLDGDPQRALQRRHADVLLRHLRPPDHRQRRALRALRRRAR